MRCWRGPRVGAGRAAVGARRSGPSRTSTARPCSRYEFELGFMTPQQTNIPSLRHDAAVLPAPVLDNLAARFRPSGLFLLVLRQDGSVAYHDAGAGVFFERYLLPLLKAPQQSGLRLSEKIEALDPAAGGAGGAGGAVAAW